MQMRGKMANEERDIVRPVRVRVLASYPPRVKLVTREREGERDKKKTKEKERDLALFSRRTRLAAAGGAAHLRDVKAKLFLGRRDEGRPFLRLELQAPERHDAFLCLLCCLCLCCVVYVPGAGESVCRRRSVA